MIYQAIRDAVGEKFNQDIVIIGKGPSVDAIDLSLIGGCIVININDSELVYPGDIAVFHHAWVLELFKEVTPLCKLYITDQIIQGNANQIHPEFVPYTPESADFLLDRFFSDSIYLEHSALITALRIAQEISCQAGCRKNVYLLGFDFNSKEGFTKKISTATSHSNPEYQERVISSQEHLLQMILDERQRLEINIYHIGRKDYSHYSCEAFNKVFELSRTDMPEILIQVGKSAQPKGLVKVVAECTTNHFGDMDRLKAMIVTAKQAGADYIKLQKRDLRSFYSVDQLAKPYVSPFGKTFGDYRRGIELNRDQFLLVDDFCRSIGINWFVSILDIPSYEFIREFDPEIIKLPSTISEHKELLTTVAEDFRKDVVISTGYTDLLYEEFILDTFTKVRNIYLLQCTSAYPAQNNDTQIGVVRHYYNLSKRVPRIIPGYSSHDIGSLCSMMAVAAGASMIEKHVKYGDVSWAHFDEVAVDLVNGDFAQFVSDIRSAEQIVGTEQKAVHASEFHKYHLTPPSP